MDCRRLSASMAASRSCSSVNPTVDEEATALELDVSYPRCWGYARMCAPLGEGVGWSKAAVVVRGGAEEPVMEKVETSDSEPDAVLIVEPVVYRGEYE